MSHYTYLAVNFFAVIICFIFSFHPKIKFNRHFKAFLSASIVVAVFFIAWDIWFTAHGVWWFNDRYLIGIRVFGLPIEELLFFICIPFSCIFTYYCLDLFFRLDWNKNAEKFLVIFSIITCIILAIIFRDKIYSLVTFITTAATLFTLFFILKVRWIGKASFIYFILMPGFFAVNGILTGTGLDAPIVNYNPKDFMGFRMLTIPVEDAVYGYEMILWNLFFFQKFKRNEQN
ncbi:lycopene cyclase domain-containing protein [Chryseobacterium sp.]|uniref:lycopene cyclase domain-containing protein n=1 Tax=Chryseobacterium sp. TaxID=1871047 RepID=UPI00289EAC1D|nr:lycopene cyclase domain-containing protein [Chryseobacterium sp.]